MRLGELLDRIRATYLADLAAAVEEACRSDAQLRALTEPEFRNAAGEAVRDGALDTPMRSDVVVLRGGTMERSLQVASSRHVDFEPVVFTWADTLRVAMRPFHWDDCQLSLKPAPDSHEPLARWFKRWFEPQDPDAAGLLGVVHFMSDPVVNEGVSQLSIDFGSAPAVALEELFDACVELGVRELTLDGAQGSD